MQSMFMSHSPVGSCLVEWPIHAAGNLAIETGHAREWFEISSVASRLLCILGSIAATVNDAIGTAGGTISRARSRTAGFALEVSVSAFDATTKVVTPTFDAGGYEECIDKCEKGDDLHCRWLLFAFLVG